MEARSRVGRWPPALADCFSQMPSLQAFRQALGITDEWYARPLLWAGAASSGTDLIAKLAGNSAGNSAGNRR
jgi:hypothetical protein